VRGPPEPPPFNIAVPSRAVSPVFFEKPQPERSLLLRPLVDAKSKIFQTVFPVLISQAT